MSSRAKKPTKEEKIARKKQLAEEKRLKKLETEKQQLRDELQREKTFTQNSRRILDDHWESICGEITQKDLLESLNCHRTNIEKQLDVKDGTIEKLKRWREEAGIQHKRLFEGHLKVIEYLMRIQKYFTDCMKSNYEDTIKELLMEFTEDTEKKAEILKEKEDFYENRQHAMNLLLASKYKHEKIQHDNKKLEIQFEAIDTRNKHQIWINSQLKALQNQIREIYEIFHRTSAHPKRMKVYEKLQKGDLSAMNDLNRLKIEREKCEQEISKLNQELLDIETGEGQKLIALRHERKILERIYWDLKERARPISRKISYEVTNVIFKRNFNVKLSDITLDDIFVMNS
ncbi:ninein-like protein [Culicoides brevitarsis]|uniref:ninein-like protein n=1 Tax=Culicoides brevitarsis TaxID=469753 RepID=UPI00307C43FA